LTKPKHTKKEIVFDPALPRIALVVWEDATQLADGAWMDTNHIKIMKEYSPKLFSQVGFVIKDFPEGIILTEAWNATLVANPTQIPRGMIRSIEYLS
jgi:hypothetical protein